MYESLTFMDLCLYSLEKEMATDFSVLAWRILGMAEPGGLPSMGSHRVAHNWSDVFKQYLLSLYNMSFESVYSWTIDAFEELMLLNCGVGEDSWEFLGQQGDPTSPFWRRSALGFLWREWCWSWNSSTLATSCEELTHWKRLWCWEGLGARGEGDERGWDGWMASLTRWTWVWVNSGSGDGQGGLACCNSWGRKESDTTEWLKWTELNSWKRLKQLSMRAHGVFDK